MNDLPRDKYDILDLIFTILHTLCMFLTAIFLLHNLIVSLIFVIIVVLFAFVVLFFWISRNPFNIYLIRAFAINNLFFTFIALLLFSSRISATLIEYQLGYPLLLLPSVLYLIIMLKFSAFSLRRDKRAGLMLAYTGRSEAARNLLIRGNMEEKIKRKELIAKQKKEYNQKIIIALTIALTLSSFAALIFGFY